MPNKKLTKSKMTIAALASVTALGLASQASASSCQDITISTGADDNSPVPAGSLREAYNTIAAAGNCGDFHTIRIPSSISSIELEYFLENSKNTHIIGPGKDNLTISREVNAAPSEVQFNTGVNDLKLTGFTISGVQTSLSGESVIDDMRFKDGDALQVGSTSTITNSEFLNNNGTNGGALYANLGAGASLTISGSKFDGNNASAQGGGIYIQSNSTEAISITTSSITNNTALNDGGGLYIDGATSQDIKIINSTISNNKARNGGGFNISGGDLNIISSTIVENETTDGYGGGFAKSGNAEINLNHVILAKNFETGGSINNLSAGINSINYTVIGDTNSSSITTQENSETDIDDSSLELGELADNGGLGLSHLPLDLKLVEAGSSTTSLETDQRGEKRLSGNKVDIGSIEVNLDKDAESIGKKSGGSSGSLNHFFIMLFGSLVMFRRRMK